MSDIETLHSMLIEKYMGLIAISDDPRVLKEAREFLRDNDITVASIGEETPDSLNEAIELDVDAFSNYVKEAQNG